MPLIKSAHAKKHSHGSLLSLITLKRAVMSLILSERTVFVFFNIFILSTLVQAHFFFTRVTGNANLKCRLLDRGRVVEGTKAS